MEADSSLFFPVEDPSQSTLVNVTYTLYNFPVADMVDNELDCVQLLFREIHFHTKYVCAFTNTKAMHSLYRYYGVAKSFGIVADSFLLRFRNTQTRLNRSMMA